MKILRQSIIVFSDKIQVCFPGYKSDSYDYNRHWHTLIWKLGVSVKYSYIWM